MKLFLRVAEHREIFFRYSWVDYKTHRPGRFRLVPSPEQRPDWEADYEAMRGFEEILAVVGEFQDKFNATAET